MRKIVKNKCEIETCNEADPTALHLHHIIERTIVTSSNHPFNLAILCSNCHSKVHAGKIKIVGIYPSTLPPNGRTLIYELDGKPNVEGITDPYVNFKNKSWAIPGKSE